MEDEQIIELYLQRNEKAVKESQKVWFILLKYFDLRADKSSRQTKISYFLMVEKDFDL